MMIVVCMLVSLWALLMTVLYFCQKRHIRSLNMEVREICENGGYRRILLRAPDRELEKLLQTINCYIEVCQKKQNELRQKDMDFKHQISNISHDLRTPLTSILGYVQLVKRSYDTADVSVKEYLDIIEHKAELLKNLITQFYDLSRLEGSEYEFEMDAVNLGVLMSQIIADEYDALEQQNFDVEISIASEPLIAVVDRKAMARVYTNLIHNVLKHGKEKLKIDVYASDEKIVTEIANKSDSISDDELKCLFERFFTMDRMRSGQNTGLGLAIVKQFVEKMGGMIHASYKDGYLIMHLEMKRA